MTSPRKEVRYLTRQKSRRSRRQVDFTLSDFASQLTASKTFAISPCRLFPPNMTRIHGLGPPPPCFNVIGIILAEAGVYLQYFISAGKSFHYSLIFIVIDKAARTARKHHRFGRSAKLAPNHSTCTLPKPLSRFSGHLLQMNKSCNGLKSAVSYWK